ncbi:DnaJ -like protein subfamily C member 14 [Triplophysa tibetana]|uniref:DnaJ-like protein subfamily C member 14 n=1 Tax=Triplophysa tibetana TaxID=1572043 RepID=A0A5A9NFG6_9TELE|nr:DnaJ -like protein subfamily C member 14 [Triplophysa tibetana]
MNEMADMAVDWDTVAETVHIEQPAVSLVNSSDGDDGHVKVSPGSECENGSELPHEHLDDMEAEESKEQNENNSTTEDLNDDQEENHDKDRLKEKKLEKEPSMDGESKSRNAGSGKKGKPKRSGSGQGLCDQTALLTSPFSMSQKSFLSSSGPNRHKQVRKRNHYMHNHGRTRQRNGLQLVVTCRDFVAESISPWCISCVHMIVELIISLTHRCGIAVESSGIALYEFGAHLFWKFTDVPGMTEDLRRILDLSRHLTVALLERVSRTAGLAQQSLVSGMRTLSVAVCRTSQIMSRVLVRLAGERGRKWWLSLQCSRLFRKVSEIPEEDLDPFSVLGVDIHATESELKRAYRQLAIQIHPDKNKHPGADEAFKVLRAAWDIVSNPETRREYELKRMATTELSKSMNDFLAKLQDDLKEAMNTMMCTKCEGKHKRFEMEREASEARFCAECKKWHSAEEGDLWAESSMLGLRITYFAFMDGKVFDITEWAGCQRIGISPDTHRVPYHISFGSKGSSSATRHRSPPDHPGGGAPADLQDFFSSFFQGGVPNNVSANGGFFSEGTPSNQGFRAAAGTAGMFSGSPPQTGFFSSATQRSEPNENWTEGGKAPRRRKKVRKPFQH